MFIKYMSRSSIINIKFNFSENILLFNANTNSKNSNKPWI